MSKTYIKSDEFIQLALENDCDEYLIVSALKSLGKSSATTTAVRNRLSNYRRKGLLPLDSGNTVGIGEHLIGSSTLYDSEGSIIQQWVKTDTSKEAQLSSIQQVITSMCEGLQPLPTVPSPTVDLDDVATLYISNDVHLGMLASELETGQSWNLDDGVRSLQSAYDYLFATSPNSKVGIVVDLGDLTEADGLRNSTAKSGNPLDLSDRFPDVLRAAYRSLIYAIEKALAKHEVVYFYNVDGNHDQANSIAIREILIQTFKDNPRVIINPSCNSIRYHQHGKTLIGFAHGDGLKMAKAGETMTVDCQTIFSETRHRFFHFGHTHVDAVRDGAICKAESHRNLPAQNQWAHHAGYRRGVGTMKAISYSSELGEISRSTFNMTV